MRSYKRPKAYVRACLGHRATPLSTPPLDFKIYTEPRCHELALFRTQKLLVMPTPPETFGGGIHKHLSKQQKGKKNALVGFPSNGFRPPFSLLSICFLTACIFRPFCHKGFVSALCKCLKKSSSLMFSTFSFRWFFS